ncbi:hypothetical protein, partial [Diaphorobacter nitroreducens]
VGAVQLMQEALQGAGAQRLRGWTALLSAQQMWSAGKTCIRGPSPAGEGVPRGVVVQTLQTQAASCQAAFSFRAKQL